MSEQIDKKKLEGIFPVNGFSKTWHEKNKGKHRETLRLVFFCTLIKREVIKKIGVLDERYVLGNFEDDDYCRRAVNAGFKCLVAEDTFIYHIGHVTFKSEKIDFDATMKLNHAKYKQKWGDK